MGLMGQRLTSYRECTRDAGEHLVLKHASHLIHDPACPPGPVHARGMQGTVQALLRHFPPPSPLSQTGSSTY